MKVPGCPLCDGPGGVPVFDGPKFRVIRAQEAGFPAFYRLVWRDHVAEFTDLAGPDRELCMAAVVEVELLLRSHLRPAKVNLAALGNAVPHLHWHIVARFAWDSHFPAPVWAAPARGGSPQELAAVERLLPALEADLVSRLARMPGNYGGS
ncbi:MAG: HIT family protein [Ramlibacter sp.]|nr:HIT family protein [Ramlibacter sp.]